MSSRIVHVILFSPLFLVSIFFSPALSQIELGMPMMDGDTSITWNEDHHREEIPTGCDGCACGACGNDHDELGLLFNSYPSSCLPYDPRPACSSEIGRYPEAEATEELFRIIPTCSVDPCLCGFCVPDPLPFENTAPEGWQKGSSLTPDDTPNGLLVHFAQYSPPQQINDEPGLHGLINLKSHLIGTSLIDSGSFCPDQNLRPWSFFRESFLSRARMQNCTLAVDGISTMQNFALQRAVKKITELTGKAPDASSLIDLVEPEDIAKRNHDPEIHELAVEAYNEYADSCLRKIEDVISANSSTDPNKSNILRLSTAPGSTQSLLESVGLLSNSDRSSFSCSASLVRIAGVPHLITAAHCVGRIRQQSDGIGYIESINNNLWFTSYTGHTLKLEVSNDLIGLDISYHRDDIVAAPLAVEIDRPLVEMAVYPLETWEPMIIVGLNSYLETIAISNGLSGIELLRASISIEMGSDCRARASDRGRLRYMCQSASRTSGAPIYAWREGRLVLAGIHLGSIAARSVDNMSCETGVVTGGANRGISLRAPYVGRPESPGVSTEASPF